MAKKSHPAEGFTQATEASSEASFAQSPEVYEVGFHLVPTIAEAQVGAAVEKIRAIIGDAERISEAYPTKVTLAYVIERAAQGKREKYSEAWFGWIKFAQSPERVPAIEAALTASPDVLRFLIITTVREDVVAQKPRAVFSSDRLEGETIKRVPRETERGGEVSDAELNKSIDALTQE